MTSMTSGWVKLMLLEDGDLAPSPSAARPCSKVCDVTRSKGTEARGIEGKRSTMARWSDGGCALSPTVMDEKNIGAIRCESRLPCTPRRFHFASLSEQESENDTNPRP